MVRTITMVSRYLVLLAVASIGVAAMAVLVYGVILTAQVVMRPMADGVGSATTKALMLGTIELVDLFMLGATLYVVAIGLYELSLNDTSIAPP